MSLFKLFMDIYYSSVMKNVAPTAIASPYLDCVVLLYLETFL